MLNKDVTPDLTTKILVTNGSRKRFENWTPKFGETRPICRGSKTTSRELGKKTATETTPFRSAAPRSVKYAKFSSVAIGRRGSLRIYYKGSCQVGHLSNRTILPKICLKGQFIILGICRTGQLENLGSLTVLVMLN